MSESVPPADALFAALYRELHLLAERELRRAGEVTLGTTTLLHEAYLKLSAGDRPQFESRGHLLVYAARAMRTLTIDYVRRGRAHKRGGRFQLVALDDDADAPVPVDEEARAQLEGLDAALATLAEADPPLAELVDLHFFGGLSFVEIAKLRGVSERTIQRDWRRARLLLHRTLGAPP